MYLCSMYRHKSTSFALMQNVQFATIECNDHVLMEAQSYSLKMSKKLAPFHIMNLYIWTQIKNLILYLFTITLLVHFLLLLLLLLMFECSCAFIKKKIRKRKIVLIIISIFLFWDDAWSLTKVWNSDAF